MEGKNGIMMSALLVIVVVVGQIQVGAATFCCPNMTARDDYVECSFLTHLSKPDSFCASAAGCTLVDEGVDCPAGSISDVLQNTSSVNEYCKLGCVSTVCGAITTLQHSDANEIMNGAVEKCTYACSSFCTKGAVETA